MNHQVKKFAAGFVAMSAIFAGAVAAQDAPTIDTTGAVNIRSGAGTTFTVLAVRDGVFTITGRTAEFTDDSCVGDLASSGWLRISFGGGEGWVNGCIGEITGDATTLPVVEASAPVLIAEANRATATVEGDLLLENVDGVIAFVQGKVVNVRQNPTVASTKIGQLRKADEGETYLYAIGRNEAATWVQVTYNDGEKVVTGWVARFLLQLPNGWQEDTPVK